MVPNLASVCAGRLARDKGLDRGHERAVVASGRGEAHIVRSRPPSVQPTTRPEPSGPPGNHLGGVTGYLILPRWGLFLRSTIGADPPGVAPSIAQGNSALLVATTRC